MIEKPKLASTNLDKKNSVFLHQDIIDILFEHRRQVKNIFLKIKGHHEISHFGINIISPSNELVAFSSMPHIEYNVIQQQLWRYDPCFCSKTLTRNTLYWWEDIIFENPHSEQLKEIKLRNFSAGITICREINNFCFLYSYATESRKNNLREYYTTHIYNLIDIGDYFCKSLMDIYANYCNKYALPQFSQLKSKASDLGIRSAIKLIINNS